MADITAQDKIMRLANRRADEYEINFVRVCRRKNFVRFDEAKGEGVFADAFRADLYTADGRDYHAEMPTLGEALVELGRFLQKWGVTAL